MELSILLIQQICQLFIMIFFGFLLVRGRVLTAENSKVLSILLLYVACPCAIINSFMIDFTSDKLIGLGISFLGAILVHIIFIPLANLLGKIFGFTPIEKATLIYSNSGNLIIPIVMSLFGKEWVIYASCFIVVQTFLFWTHCRLIIVGKGNLSLKMIAKNINIWSILVGAFLFAFQIKLPSIINGTLSSIGLFIGPNAMLVAGMLIAAIPLRSIVSSKRIYLVTLLRLLLIPIALLVLIKLIGFVHWVEKGEIIVLISFLATTSPSASTVTQMAVIYNNNPQKASAIYGITTLLCMFTMPLVIALYQIWG